MNNNPLTKNDVKGFSVHYTAPDCFHQNFDCRADIFSFGVILYEVLYGKKPFLKDIDNEWK
jgi:serine/threonine protein kinase